VPPDIWQRTPGQKRTHWYEQETPLFQQCYTAYEFLHIPLREYLHWPQGEREMVMAYLTAKSMKQRAMDKDLEADRKHREWESTWKQQQQQRAG
jgi:hypothetical protein